MKIRLLQVGTLGMVAVVFLLAGGWNALSRMSEPRGEEVTTAELPSPVKATLDRESAGKGAREIEKIVKDGNTAYRAHIQANGRSQEITIGEDGALLDRDASDDDDDDDDD